MMIVNILTKDRHKIDNIEKEKKNRRKHKPTINTTLHETKEK